MSQVTGKQKSIDERVLLLEARYNELKRWFEELVDSVMQLEPECIEQFVDQKRIREEELAYALRKCSATLNRLKLMSEDIEPVRTPKPLPSHSDMQPPKKSSHHMDWKPQNDTSWKREDAMLHPKVEKQLADAICTCLGVDETDRL